MLTGPTGFVRAVMAALVFAIVGLPELITQFWNTRLCAGNLGSFYMAFRAAFENALFAG